MLPKPIIRVPKTCLDAIYKEFSNCGYAITSMDFNIRRSAADHLNIPDPNILIVIYNGEMLKNKRIRELLLEYLI
jgi:hypothetical protein